MDLESLKHVEGTRNLCRNIINSAQCGTTHRRKDYDICCACIRRLRLPIKHVADNDPSKKARSIIVVASPPKLRKQPHVMEYMANVLVRREKNKISFTIDL